ncbi:Protein CROWDED NUCLEI 2 [Linum grandiflorum]
MFPRQRRPSPAITLTPRNEGHKGAGTSNAATPNPRSVGKGKAVAFVDGPSLPPPHPPPTGLLSDSDMATEDEDFEAWRRFRELGLLDEAVMERKDHEALMEKASILEKELFDYQYNMGLLLIEKKEWTAKLEELRQAVEEAQEILKRDQSAHLIALSEMERREQSLREALRVEQQCVADLEKSLRELSDEHVRVKHASETKLANAEALVAGIEGKSVAVKENMHTVEEKLSEVNQKSKELDLKLQEVEAREISIQRERLSLNTDREAYEAALFKQREDLHEWERQLQRKEEKLGDLRRELNQREEKAGDGEAILKQKEVDLEEMKKKIDLSFEKLKEREVDVDNHLADLAVKEKSAESQRSSLERKEKELQMWEEKLTAREQVDIPDIVDGHRATLDAQMQELELELEQRRKSLDEELKGKKEKVEKLDAEILHREEMLGKREEALNKKAERVKEREKNLDAKLKMVKEREKSLKAEQRKLELEKRQLLADKESYQNLKDEFERIKTEVSQQEQEIGERNEGLKIINEERLEFLRLREELKSEREKCRHQEEFLLKEGEELNAERESFEKELELLEGKRTQIEKEQKEMAEEREKLEKFRHVEEERLKKEEDEMKEHVHREMETLRVEKEAFEARLSHEQSLLSEKHQMEHDCVVQELESQRRNLDVLLISKKEEMEKSFRAKESAFQELKHKELKNIEHLKETAQKEFEQIQSEKQTLEKGKIEILIDKEDFGRQQAGMLKDISELESLSRKLRDQREQVMRERNNFLAFAEKCKNCKNCRDIAGAFVLSDLQPPEIEVVTLPRLGDGIIANQGHINGSGVSSVQNSLGKHEMGQISPPGPTSLLSKCTSMIFSPTKRMVSPSSLAGASTSSARNVNSSGKTEGSGMLAAKEARLTSIPGDQPQASFGDGQQHQTEASNRGGDEGPCLSADDHSYIDSKVQEFPEDSEQSVLKNTEHRRGRRRKTAINRTRSVKTVVEEAKKFLGESHGEPEHNLNEQPDDLYAPSDDSRVISSRGGKAPSNVARKRQRAPSESQQDVSDSEGGSVSITAGGRRKRRQTVPSVTSTPVQTRYNLRRNKNAAVNSAVQALPVFVKNQRREANAGAATAVEQPSVGVADEPHKSTNSMQVTTHKNAEAFDARNKMKAPDVDEEVDAAKSVQIVELSEEVIGTTEYMKEEDGSTIHEEDEAEDDNENEESEHPGQASIGKKIWTFFTT